MAKWLYSLRKSMLKEPSLFYGQDHYGFNLGHSNTVVQETESLDWYSGKTAEEGSV